MKTFAYHRPADVAAAAALLAATPDSIPVAGGMSLLPVMKFRLAEHAALIDLSGIAALRGITVSADSVTIGAGTTHVDVADRRRLPLRFQHSRNSLAASATRRCATAGRWAACWPMPTPRPTIPPRSWR
jgi:carbon-monoxide dehydrogenase medium subunit